MFNVFLLVFALDFSIYFQQFDQGVFYLFRESNTHFIITIINIPISVIKAKTPSTIPAIAAPPSPVKYQYRIKIKREIFMLFVY